MKRGLQGGGRIPGARRQLLAELFALADGRAAYVPPGRPYRCDTVKDLNEFFEPPPPLPADTEPRYRMPPWFGPPSGTLPGVVAIERVLARTEKVAVSVTGLAAYPSGFEVDIVTMSADERDGLDPFLFERPHHRIGRDAQNTTIPPEMLRLGVQFADGSKATNTGGFQPHEPGAPPAGPLMTPRGGGGGGGNWQQSLWVWPLPPPGPLVLVCEWPAAGVPLTRSEVDAQLILDAAARAQVVFSDEHLPLPGDEDPGSGTFAQPSAQW